MTFNFYGNNPEHRDDPVLEAMEAAKKELQSALTEIIDHIGDDAAIADILRESVNDALFILEDFS